MKIFTNQERHLLEEKVLEAYQQKEVLPSKENLLEAFKIVNPYDVQVVILGQDPYPNPQNAHGLAFSSLDKKTPASLRNIKKSLMMQGFQVSQNNNLSSWAKQGVLLINEVLIIEKGKPGSLKDPLWKVFTKKLLSYLSQENENCVFLLWGKKAQSYEKYLDNNKHLILKGFHPSPLSAYHGFFKVPWFLKTNEYLSIKKKKPINWDL